MGRCASLQAALTAQEQAHQNATDGPNVPEEEKPLLPEDKEAPSKSLQQLLELGEHDTSSLDLSKPLHFLIWTELREYIRLDIRAFSISTDIIVASSLVYMSGFVAQGLCLYTFVSAWRLRSEVMMLVIVINALLFLYVFVQAANKCIALNDAFEQDAAILLKVERETRLEACRSDGGAKQWWRHVELLATTRCSIEQEEKQAIWGIPVTSTMRNTILISLASSLGAAAFKGWTSMASKMHEVDNSTVPELLMT